MPAGALQVDIWLPVPHDDAFQSVTNLRVESPYHSEICWAEFYAAGIGWVPVDPSEAAKNPARREYFFGAHDENRN